MVEITLKQIRDKIEAINFEKYNIGITQRPDHKLIKKFMEWFEFENVGTPLLAMDSNYIFALTTEYLFWWDDCEGYGCLSIDDVKLVADEDLDGVFASDKDDTYGGFIVDDDIVGGKKMRFVKDMNDLINFMVGGK